MNILVLLAVAVGNVIVHAYPTWNSDYNSDQDNIKKDEYESHYINDNNEISHDDYNPGGGDANENIYSKNDNYGPVYNYSDDYDLINRIFSRRDVDADYNIVNTNFYSNDGGHNINGNDDYSDYVSLVNKHNKDANLKEFAEEYSEEIKHNITVANHTKDGEYFEDYLEDDDKAKHFTQNKRFRLFNTNYEKYVLNNYHHNDDDRVFIRHKNNNNLDKTVDDYYDEKFDYKNNKKNILELSKDSSYLDEETEIINDSDINNESDEEDIYDDYINLDFNGNYFEANTL